MSPAVHQLAVHTVRDRESGVRAGRVTPPNRPFLEPSVRGRSRVWGAGNGPSGTVRPTVERLGLDCDLSPSRRVAGCAGSRCRWCGPRQVCRKHPIWKPTDLVVTALLFVFAFVHEWVVML